MRKINIKLIFVSFLVGIVLGALCTKYVCIIYNEEQAKTIRTLGLKEYENKNYYQAIQLFSMAIGLNQDWYEAHLALANSYLAIGNYELSLSEYEHALDLNKEKDLVEKADRKYILNRLDFLKEKRKEVKK